MDYQKKLENALMALESGYGLAAYVKELLHYAYILAGILMIVMVGVKVATYFANPAKDFDPYTLIRPILIIVALALYQPLVTKLLFEPSELITKITEEAARKVTKSDDGEGFEKLFLKHMTFVDWSGSRPDYSEEADDGEEAGDSEESGGISDYLVFPLLEVLHFLIYIVAYVISLYIVLRYIISKGLYFVLGVFVLPFSMIPGNDEIIKKWFFGYLAVLMWIPILRILQTIMILMRAVDSVDIYVAPLYSLALQICMIFFIIQIPKYANMLVSGSGDSDSNSWLVFVGRESYYRALGMNSSANQRRHQ